MTVKHLKPYLILAVLILFLSGCEPTQRVIWSLDGTRMAVLANDGLRLSNASGQLSRPLVRNVHLARWLPDSKHILVETSATARNWRESSQVLSPAEIKQVLKTARKLRTIILINKSSWDKAAEKQGLTDFSLAMEALIYLREHYRNELAPRLGTQWKDIEQITTTIYTLQAYEVTGDGLTAGKVLYRCRHPVQEVRISPTAEVIAMAEQTDGQNQEAVYRLLVLPIGGGTARQVAQQATQFPDWSPDGRFLLYIRPQGSNPKGVLSRLRLGSLSKLEVCSQDGSVRKIFGQPYDLVELAFDNTCRIRSLKDGRIIFSCPSYQLPAAKRTTVSRHCLFALLPNNTESVMPLTPNAQAQDSRDVVQYFEVSPDQTKIIIPSENGKISLLDLSNQELYQVQAGCDGNSNCLPFIPQWRSPDELTFASLPIKEKKTVRSEIVLWSLSSKSGQALSKNWPYDAVRCFLEDKVKDAPAD